MESKSTLFLTDEEVAELTGIRTGRGGKRRGELQVEWLRTSGLPFWVNARGAPKVPRSAIEGRPPGTPIADAPRKKWQPPIA